MIYTIYTDYHLETPQALPNNFPKDYTEVLEQNAYYLGDNVDRRGCEDISKADILYNGMKMIFKDRLITGNHELVGKVDICSKGICFTHGDAALWGETKSREFRIQSPAEGYGIIKTIFGKIRKLIDAHLSKNDINNLVNYATVRNCKVIVFGHTHTHEVQDVISKGVRIINCPRGKSEINI